MEKKEKIEADIPNRAAASAWIYKNQMGKRNLTEEERDYYMGKRYEAEKMALGETNHKDRGDDGRFIQKDQNDHSGQTNATAERISKEYGVSQITVRRNEQFADGLDEADRVKSSHQNEDMIDKGRTSFPIMIFTEIKRPPPNTNRSGLLPKGIMSERCQP